MCSVIGYSGVYDHNKVVALLLESQARGLHAFGTTYIHEGEAQTFKTHDLKELASCLASIQPSKFIAHFRYSTSGDYRNHNNNQPLAQNGTYLAFNGVLHQGTRQDMEKKFECQIPAENDGHVLLANLHDHYFLRRPDITYAAVYLDANHDLWAVRNPLRPLHYASGSKQVVVASTKDILRRAGFEHSQPVTPWTPMRL